MSVSSVRTFPARHPLALAVSMAVMMPMSATAAEERVLQDVEVTAEAAGYQTQILSSPKFTAPLRDTPQSITVIPQKLLEDQTTTTLRDAFRNITGISITAGEGNPSGGDQLTLRGFTARDDIFVDGMRDLGIYTRDPFNIESIEVVKGPSSSYNGRGSVAGSINQVSKEARLSRFTRSSVTLGDDMTTRLTTDINTQISETSALRINMLSHRNEINGRDFVENERQGVAASLGMGLGTPTRVFLNGFYTRQDNIPDFGIPNPRNQGTPAGGIADAPPVRTLPSRFHNNFFGALNRDKEEVEVYSLTGRFERDVNENLLVRNQLRYLEASIDRVVSAPRFACDGTTGCDRIGTPGDGALGFNKNSLINRNTKPRDQVDTLFVNQTDVIFRFNDGRFNHALAGGIEVAQQTLENRRRLDTDSALEQRVTLGNPNPFLPDQEQIFNGQVVEVDTKSFGIYAADTIEINNKWSFTAAVRWDQVETRAQVNDDPNTPSNEAERVSRRDSELSYRTGLIYKPANNGTIFVGYGTSFTPVASLGATNSGFFNPAGGGSALGANNFDIEPEKTTAIEVGTKWDVFNERLSLTAAIFQTIKDGVRSDGGTTNARAGGDGRHRVRGFELGASGRIAPFWEVFGGYTFLDGRILEAADPRNNGKKTDNTPDHTFSLWNNFDVNDRIELGLGAFFVDDRTALGAGNNRDIIAPSYLRWDAAAAYKLNQKVTLRVNVNNLTNARFIETLGNAQSIPGAERTVLVSGTFKF